MSSLSAFLLNYYAPFPKLRISLKVIVGLFVLCDCPITNSCHIRYGSPASGKRGDCAECLRNGKADQKGVSPR